MKRTFLTLSLLVAGTSLLLGSSDAEARCRCRCRGGYQYQNAGYYQNSYGCGTGCGAVGCGAAGCGVTTTNANYAAPDNQTYGSPATNQTYGAPATPVAPAPPQETSPAPSPAAPAPGT